MALNVWIIEDENTAQQHLVKLLNQIDPKILVTEKIRTVKEGIDSFKTSKHPDLVLMDVQLSDGVSFDILDEVDVHCPVIYCTAYDAYAIKAFKTMGIEYLLKPIGMEDLKKALDKYYQLKKDSLEDIALQHVQLSQLLKPKSGSPYKTRFLLKQGQGLIPVETDEIAYFYRDGSVFVKCFNGNTYIFEGSLNQTQKSLNPDQFVRLNRQILVNTRAIVKLNPLKPGQICVDLNPPHTEPITLSPERSRWLKIYLDKTP